MNLFLRNIWLKSITPKTTEPEQAKAALWFAKGQPVGPPVGGYSHLEIKARRNRHHQPRKPIVVSGLISTYNWSSQAGVGFFEES